MLRTALPISAADKHLAIPLLKRLIGWKAELEERTFVMVCAWKDHFDVKELYDQFRTIFPKTALVVLPDVPEDRGWPDAANHMFYGTAGACAGDPFYFMEADCFPLQPCFIDELEHEYEAAGKPYMGAIEPSRWTIKGEYKEVGKHMVGTGIYPADFLTKSKRIHTVSEGAPWDVYIESEVVPECHETKLIHHAWGTARYKRDGEIITCEDHVVRPGKHSYAKPVPAEALVAHGCKDLSLYEIFK